MTLKARKPVTGYGNDKALVYASLFLVCAFISALGLGAAAFWCFVPAAIVVDALSRLGPRLRRERRRSASNLCGRVA